MISAFFKCFFGPRLYRIYKIDDQAGRPYTDNLVEKVGDSVVKLMNFCYSFCKWTSPVLLFFFYGKVSIYFTTEGMIDLGRLGVRVGAFVLLALFCRSLGRLMNTDYVTFIEILSQAQTNNSHELKTLLRHYDSDFGKWPVDYSWKETYNFDKTEGKPVTSRLVKAQPIDDGFHLRLLSYIAANTFGLRLAYPGYTDLINLLTFNMLIQGRTNLVEDKKGYRAKLEAEDGNHIDTMFVDRRGTSDNGNTLVICSEGNAGFYEIGSMVSPLDSNYSVLGWNHPGFAGSTGAPFPSQEQAAIDIVFQYAINKLGFMPDNIVLFGWSIGGYAVSWCAKTYPDIKAVILDATFDDIYTLAFARLPKSWYTLIKTTIKHRFNLDIGDLICQYNGPLRLIRRTKDEVITTSDTPIPAIVTNRGNFLLVKVLKIRYPNIMNEETESLLWRYLGCGTTEKESLYLSLGVEDEMCTSILQSYVSEHGHAFPYDLGNDLPTDTKNQLVLFLANKYMVDFESTHCTPLPTSHFQIPWSVNYQHISS